MGRGGGRRGRETPVATSLPPVDRVDRRGLCPSVPVGGDKIILLDFILVKGLRPRQDKRWRKKRSNGTGKEYGKTKREKKNEIKNEWFTK